MPPNGETDERSESSLSFATRVGLKRAWGVFSLNGAWHGAITPISRFYRP
jgi:hypothetical protein